jgi:prevent-host-death family protein
VVVAIVNMHEAKTHLSELVARAEAGEEVVIARAGRAAVRLVPVDQRCEPRGLGWLRGVVPPPADEALIGEDLDVLALFADDLPPTG